MRFNWLRRRTLTRRPNVARRCLGSSTPWTVELLETRLTPASITWNGLGANDNWSTAANWVGGVTPGASDTAVFDGTSAKNCVVDVGFAGTVSNLSIGGGYTGTITLNENLAVTGDLTVGGGIFSANGQTTIVGGLTTVSGGTYQASTATQTLSGGLSVSGGSFTGSNGAVAAAGVTLSGGTLTAPSGAFTVSGNWSETGGTFVPGSGTVTFTAASGTQTLDSGGSSFYSIVHSGTGTLTLVGDALTVTNSFSNAAGTFALAGQNWTMTGATFSNAGTVQLYGSESITGLTQDTGEGTWDYVGNGAGPYTIDDFGATDYYNLTIAPTDGTDSFQLAAPLAVSGSLTVSGGSFLPGTNSVTFSGGGTQTLNSGGNALYSVVHSGSGTLKLAGNALTVTHSLTISSGTLALAGQNWTMTGATFSNAGTVQLYGSETITGLTQDTGEGTWDYVGNGAGPYTIDDFGATDYYNLTIAAANGTDSFRLAAPLALANKLTVSGGTYNANGQTTTVSGLTTVSGGTYQASTATQTLSGGLTVSGGSFTGSSGTVATTSVSLSAGTLTAPSGTFTLTGNWTKSGGTFTPGTNTVTFNGGGTQTLNSGGSSFYNLTESGTSALQLTAPLSLSGNLTVSGGSFVPGSNAVTFSGGGTQTLNSGGSSFYGVVHSGSGTLKLAGNALTVTHNLTISSGTLALAGQNWTMTGATFSNAGTVQLYGSETITGLTQDTGEGTWDYVGNGAGPYTIDDFGTTDYYSLTIAPTDGTDSFRLAAPLAVNGSLTVSGGSFQPGSNAVTFSGGGTQTLNSGGNALYSVVHSGSGTLKLAGNALTVTSSFSNAAGIFALAGQNWTMTGATFSNAGTVQLYGSETITGLTQDTGEGTWDYVGNGAGPYTIDDFGATDYYSLTIAPSDGTDTFRLAAPLTVTHNLTISSGTLALAGQNWTMTGATFSNAGTVQLYGSETITGLTQDTGEGTWDYVGNGAGPYTIDDFGATDYFNLTIAPSDGTDSFRLAAPLAVSGSLTFSGGSFQPGTNSVTFSGGGTQTLNSGGNALYSVVHSGSGTLKLAGNALTVTNSFSNAAGTFALAGQNWTMTGATFSNAGTVQLYGSEVITGLTQDTGEGTWDYVGNGAGPYTIDDFGATDYYSLTIAPSDGTDTFRLAAPLTVTHNLTISSGTLALAGQNWTMTGATFSNTGTVQLYGSETITGLTQSTTAGTWDYVGNGAGPYTIDDFGVTDYYNLTIAPTDGTDSFLAANALTVAHNLTVSSGVYNANGQTVTVAGVTTVSGGTYQASTATQTLSGGLTVSGGSFAGSSGAVTTAGVTLSSGTLTAPSGTFSVSGNWSKTGGTFTPGTNTVTFNGGGTQTLNSGGSGFYNLTEAGGGTLQLTAALSVANSLAVSGGTLNANGQTATVSGVTTVGGGTYQASTATQTLSGGLAVSGGSFTGSSGAVATTVVTLSAGTLTAPSGTFTVSGDWNRTGGTFVPGTGTVTLTGTDQHILGTTTFYSLTKSPDVADTLYFDAAGTQTVNGSLTLQGTAGQPLALQSTVPGQQWTIRVTSATTQQIRYVNVQDSNAGVPGTDTALVPAQSTDSGDNTNWLFSLAVTVTLPAGPSTVYGTALTFTVTASAAGSTPAGTVQFQIDGVDFGPLVALSGGTATSISTATLSATSHTVTANYYSGDTGRPTLTGMTTQLVTPAPLTVAGFTVANKIYDATTAATIVSNGSLIGVVPGDSVSLNGSAAVATFDNANVGTTHVVSAAGYTLSGAQASNYTLMQPSASNVTISPMTLTVAAAPNTRTYDSTTAATAVPTVSGLQGGDTVTRLAEAYSSPNAGTNKTLVVTSYTVNDGNGGHNYTVTTVNNTAGVINRAPLTITAAPNSKTYDTTTSAGAMPAVSGLQGGDSVTGLAEAYNNANAGAGKTLVVTSYTVNDGNGGGNYTVTTVNNTAGVINQAALTISATSNTKTYDATTAAGATPTVSGLQGGDSVSGLAEAYTDANAGPGKTLVVTAYTVNDGDGGHNYVVTTVNNTSGVINQAALTITATANTKTYDATASASATPTVSGLRGGDSVTGLAEAYTDANAGSGKTLVVTAYTVNDGNGGGNYTVTTVNNTAGVINRAALTITAAANTKTYDATTSAGAIPTVSGLQGGDSVTGLAEGYTDANAGSGKTLVVTSYTVNDGDGGHNYVVTAVNNTGGVIGRASLTITASANSKSYDGTPSASATPTVSGLRGGDTVTGLAEAYADANAGTGKTLTVTSYTVNDGNGGENYAVTTVDNTAGVINKAALTITAAANTKTYDATASAAATPTVSGLQGGDTVTGLVEAYADANAGSGKTLVVTSYAVNDGNGGNNYTVTTVNNTAGVINQAALTFTATANTKTYDATAAAAAIPTVSGLQGGDTVTSLAEAYSSPNAGSGKLLVVTAYTVNDGDGGHNYVVTTVNNTSGVINQAALTITATANTKTYDATTKAAATPTVSGLQGGDTVTGLAEAYTDANAASGKTLTVTAFTVNDGDGGSNYAVTTVNNTAGVINKAALTITAITNTKTYDGTTTASATPTVSGLRGSDTVTGLVEAYSDPNPGTGKTLAVTAYTVNDGNGGNNYVVTTVANDTGVIIALPNATYVVTSSADSGSGTLRQAILNADSTSGGSTISFDLSTGDPNYNNGSGEWTITLASALPALTAPATIDATTQPGYDGTPVVVLDGTAAGAGCDGMDLEAGSDGSTIAGLVIGGFGGSGIYVASADNTIRCDWIGIGGAGTAALANGCGVYVSGAQNIIGGTAGGAGNVVSGNTSYGIQLAGQGNTVEGNIIGLNAAGTAAIANGYGVYIASADNTVGGTTAAASNVISGNTADGVYITGASSSGNAVLGNSTYDNGGLGINLAAPGDPVSGVTVNTGVKTPGEPNLLMNYPVFTSGNLNGNTLTVAGYIGTAPGQSVFGDSRVEVFVADNDPAGYGEGKIYLGYLTANADGNFSGSFTASAITAGTEITGTATDTDDDTSEFGPDVAVVQNVLTSTASTSTYGQSVTFTATIEAGSGAATGTISFECAATILATVPLSSGTAVYTTSTLNAGTYTPITAVYSGGPGFLADASNALSLSVSPRALTITATPNTKTYDATTSAAATPTVSGLANGDSVTGLAEAYTDDDAGSGKTLVVTAYTVNDGNGGHNYVVTAVNNTGGVIGRAALTITAAADTKSYDATSASAATPTVSGLKGGDSVTGLAEAYADANAGTGKTLNVTAYTVNDGNGGDNYAVTTVSNAAGVINRAALTITATANAKTYDATSVAAATPTVNGLQGGDTVTGLAEAYSSPNAGSGKTLVVTSYAVNDGNGGNNYTVTTVNNTAGVINRAALTITATGNTRTYDATTAAAAIPAVGGLQGSDTVTGLAEAYADANAGSGKTLVVTSYTVDDGDGGNNYVVTTVNNTAGVINRAALTITATANTKTYDATAAASAMPAVSGLQGGDSVTGLAEAYADANAGSDKTLAVTSYTVNDGNGGHNYIVTTVNNTSGVINPAPLTITATADAKSYDATTTAVVTPTVSGLKGGDSVTGLAEAFTNANSGTGKTLIVASYTVNDGNGGDNYAVTTISNTTGVINRAALTITATANTKTYDATTAAAATPTVSGLQGGDSVTGLAEAYSSANAGSGKTLTVTNYTVNDGNGGGNYTVTTVNNTAGVINRAPLTITAAPNSKTYDTTTSAGAMPAVSGLQGVDSVTGLAEAYNNANAGAGKTLVVTSYTVNDGNGGDNYAVTTVNNTAGLIRRAALTITAAPNTKTYDATTSASATPIVNGLAGSDTVTGLAEVYTNGNAGSGKTLVVTSYSVNDGNGGNNYTVTTANCTAGVINKAALTITVASDAKTYDGTTTASATPTVSGLQGGDSVTGLAEAFASANAGNHKRLVVASYTVNDGNGGENYTVTAIAANTGVIGRADLVVTANDVTTTYADCSLTDRTDFSAYGLQNGETVGSVTLTSDASRSHSGNLSVGTWSLSASAAAGGTFSAGNYVITYVTATLTILPKSLTVTGVTAGDKVYDGTTLAVLDTTGCSLAGVVRGDMVTLNSAGATGTFDDPDVGDDKPVTTSGFRLDGPDSGDYALIQPTTAADIIPATPTAPAPEPVEPSGAAGADSGAIATAFVNTLDVTPPAAAQGIIYFLPSSLSAEGTGRPAVPYSMTTAVIGQLKIVKLGSGAPSGIISGQVVLDNSVDPAARPSDLTLFLELDSEGDYVPVGQTRLDEAGRFSFDRLAPGSYRVRLGTDTGGRQRTSAPVISLPADGAVSGLKIIIPQPPKNAAPTNEDEPDEELPPDEAAAGFERGVIRVADRCFQRLGSGALALAELPGSHAEGSPFADWPGGRSCLGWEEGESVAARAAVVLMAYGNLNVSPESWTRRKDNE